LAAIDAALLALMLATTAFGARRLGFSRADEITIVFCGSKKSLVSGIPMASVLFAGPTLGMIVLPLMIFHQLQLMACAALARRYARNAAPETAALKEGRNPNLERRPTRRRLREAASLPVLSKGIGS
jgi:sodium/bile acid cotransporter 7